MTRTPFLITPCSVLACSGLALGLTAAFAQVPVGTAEGGTTFTPEQIRFYETQIRPILKTNCFSCHGDGAGVSGGLHLTSRATVLKGGASGPALSLTRPQESLLLQAINYQGRQMPPTGKLPQGQIDLLTRWVQMGAPMPAGAPEPPDNTPVKKGPPQVNAQTMNFWSFRPVKRSLVPTVKHKAWVTNPIDAFVLAKLEARGLTPAAPAAKTALLRRATYDLTGLPPNPEEVKAFLADTSPRAYERVVDRLLASPQYGERWGRHWLDLVRYAETNSFERDDAKPFVWRYRDYVISSLNQDKPYDQFIREQLAGDELPHPTDAGLIATGYYRLGAWDDEPSDPEQARYDELDDIVATTGQTFLGLTVNCARCHDHKLDPIPQKDYYRLLSFFQGTTRYGSPVDKNSLRPLGTEEEKRRFAIQDAAYHQRLDTVNTQIKQIEDRVVGDLSNVEKEEFKHPQSHLAILKKRVPALLSAAQYDTYADLLKQQDALRTNPPRGLEQALCVTESGRTPARTFVMLRGNPHVPGEEVTPAFLSVLAPPKPNIRELPADVPSSGRRLALANWIASPANPLTARVMVNRIWQHHFGRGIVRSASNFGSIGTPPTHPELLDWLATEFIKDGWRLKPLHKLIMLSSAYRMSVTPSAQALAKDPDNDLFQHFDMRRLDAEEIRDSILAVDGSLNKKMGGPSIYPIIPAEVLAGQSRPGYGWEKSTPEDQARRSVYIHIKRSLTVPILASFDVADTDFTCPVRFATTQPTQALSLMNSAFSNEQAQVFADFVIKHAGPTPQAQVALTLSRVLQRAPTAREIDRGVNFIHAMQSKNRLTEPEALRYFCTVALNLDEFIYLD